MSSNAPSLEQLRRATEIAEQIERLRNELTALLSGRQQQGQLSRGTAQSRSTDLSAARASGGRRGGKRVISLEARARMAAAQKARWARVNGGDSSSGGGATQAKGKSKAAGAQRKGGKRTLSPEARAKIAEAARRRWAKEKSGK